MEALTEENIRKKLRAIEDPDLKQDIVSAGFVKALTIEKGNVALTLELTTPACPFKAKFRDQATELIRTLADVKTVNVTITSQAKKPNPALENSALKSVASIIAVASCKGGVGKSTIASLLACELALRGYRVGLLDADIFGPSLPTLFGLKPHGVKMKDKKLVPLNVPLDSLQKKSSEESSQSPQSPQSSESSELSQSPEPSELSGSSAPAHSSEAAGSIAAQSTKPGETTPSSQKAADSTTDSAQNSVQLGKMASLKVMSFGFLLGDAPAVMRGAMVSNYITQILHQVAWGELDYLFIDLPPGTGDTLLTLAQSVQVDGSIIVTTPASLSLVDVARGMLMFDKVNVPILGVIENMAYFTCSTCEAKHYIFEKSTRSLEERFGVPTLVQVPLVSGSEHFSFAPYHVASRLQPTITTMIDAAVRRIGMVKKEVKHTPKVAFNAQNITVTFPEGEEVTLSNHQLRLSCPCALCQDEFTGRRKLTSDKISENIAATSVNPLGNYALAIVWNDGHSSGIYSYRLLRKLAPTASRHA